MSIVILFTINDLRYLKYHLALQILLENILPDDIFLQLEYFDIMTPGSLHPKH